MLFGGTRRQAWLRRDYRPLHWFGLGPTRRGLTRGSEDAASGGGSRSARRGWRNEVPGWWI